METDFSNMSQEELEAHIEKLEDTLLDTFPDDTATLEEVVYAYEQAGNESKAKERGITLIEILIEQEKAAHAVEVANHMYERHPEDVEIEIMKDRAEEEASLSGESEEEPEETTTSDTDLNDDSVSEETSELSSEDAEPEEGTGESTPPETSEENAPTQNAETAQVTGSTQDTSFSISSGDLTMKAPKAKKHRKANRDVSELLHDLSGELDLAWFLLQNNKINQNQYELAVANLTENRLSPNAGSVQSLLHELDNMEHIYIEKIVDFLCLQTNTPYINASTVEPSAETADLIPFQQVKRLGVLPFCELGPEVMAVCMNPLDKSLQSLVSNYLDQKVHFYLTSPEEFNKAISKAEDTVKKAEQ